MKRSRLILGIALAPLALPVAYMLLLLLFSGDPSRAAGHPQTFFLDFVAVACVCYAASYVLGVPVIVGLLLARRLTVLPCALLGSLLGAVAAALTYAHYREGGVEIGVAILLGGAASLLVAGVFCLVAGVPWRRDPAAAEA
ncbi:hypothetical protein [Dyella sp. 2RAB6]|uniref:hypothetical protein n=1 Tax=Dyella sp. 2RAB6 TaxID=3232992 RepID=UPI003F922DF4